jgi:hypothetical protein
MTKQVATIGEIFTSCWEEYKRRAISILAVVLISTVILSSLVLALALSAGLGGAVLAHLKAAQNWAFILIVILCLLFLGITILALWCQTAMLAIVVDENLGIIEAFQRGWKYFRSMTWVLTIFSGIIMAGFIFGILPGILFLVWFSFCFYILFEEDKRGMDTLLASMEYVRGNWWNTFGKLLAVWFLYMLTGLIPFVGPLISILFYPFLMLFMAGLYRDLKSIRGEAELQVGGGTRLFWWALTWIGLALPVIAMVAAILALMSGNNEWMDTTIRSLQQMDV